MIVQENLEGNLIKTYSDAGMFIFGGDPIGFYTEAIDPVETHREYKETNIALSQWENEEQ